MEWRDGYTYTSMSAGLTTLRQKRLVISYDTDDETYISQIEKLNKHLEEGWCVKIFNILSGKDGDGNRYLKEIYILEKWIKE